ncbi:hypothetical protein BC936DRAFT_147570 [Jimgerdemannia flammicorona]|uniref:Uncharacterized protein n=1 Tax=Jimgerdemannia flammicorona TaxID=994334 RepID=A0A433DNA8_9FUNG|nr:hypothetical protein BC936DRAFT_147570 [Jimgerdemannia flammicorona]
MIIRQEYGGLLHKASNAFNKNFDQGGEYEDGGEKNSNEVFVKNDKNVDDNEKAVAPPIHVNGVPESSAWRRRALARYWNLGLRC